MDSRNWYKPEPRGMHYPANKTSEQLRRLRQIQRDNEKREKRHREYIAERAVSALFGYFKLFAIASQEVGHDSAE